MLIKQKQNWLSGLGLSFKIMIFALSIVSLIAYLVVVNHTNTLGIEIGEMQWTIKNLEEQYRDLQSQATALQSMTRIEQISNVDLNMVKAENYNYVAEEFMAVAAR